MKQSLLTLLVLTASVTPSLHTRSEASPMSDARGTFDVKMTPRPADDPAFDPFSRLSGDKQFHGDLEASGKSQMLAWGTGAEGSTGAYVALELVSGSLGGRRGTFILQHTGTMAKGAYHMNVTVVPGSGTEQLTGLGGTMTIVIAEGKHSYVFTYTLGGAEPSSVPR